MQYEAEVVDSVCSELESRDYQILQKLHTTQQGDDIIAIKNSPKPWKLFIEAKGETSSRSSSNRFGKPFMRSQVKVHVAEAFYKATEVLSRNQEGIEIRAGIAFPDTTNHRDFVDKI